eukprot:TRINITY_DN39517_c0_g1_i1.p1 TRINITY_DN39517_c0_g1~~TRINITY_DN39517_c0_g1_i1.p1  ORF type:complete len:516 (+),score=66.39 TRINITY_DN39517_c0_g1_i1:48-1550(+)
MNVVGDLAWEEFQDRCRRDGTPVLETVSKASLASGKADALLVKEASSIEHKKKLMKATTTEISILEKVSTRHPLAAHCFSCMEVEAEKVLLQVVRECGENKELDAVHREYDYSLWRGRYRADAQSQTVELEGTEESPLTADMQRAAVYRLKEFYHPLIPLGCVLYLLGLGGGFVSGYVCECSDGPAPWGFGFIGVGIALQLYWLNRITILLSQTQVEGRELLRLLSSLQGLDNYRFLSLMAVVDFFSLFMRAQFVGYLQHCNNTVDISFTSAFEHDGLRQIADRIGIEGLAFGSFVLGPVIIQFSYMLFLRCKLKKELEEASEKKPGQVMDVTDSIDDLGALMAWARLAPAGKVMDLAAVPINLDGDEDVDRIWDRLKTSVWVALARDIPDGVFLMFLQSWFFCLVDHGIDWSTRGQLLMNIVLATITVVGDAADLIIANRRITVAAGFFLLLLLVEGIARTTCAFMCESGVKAVEPWAFSCLPYDQIARGSWKAGTLPG